MNFWELNRHQLLGGKEISSESAFSFFSSFFRGDRWLGASWRVFSIQGPDFLYTTRFIQHSESANYSYRSSVDLTYYFLSSWELMTIKFPETQKQKKIFWVERKEILHPLLVSHREYHLVLPRDSSSSVGLRFQGYSSSSSVGRSLLCEIDTPFRLFLGFCYLFNYGKEGYLNISLNERLDKFCELQLDYA